MRWFVEKGIYSQTAMETEVYVSTGHLDVRKSYVIIL